MNYINDNNNYINEFFFICLFFQIYNVLQDHPQEGLSMFWL
jgi:hypothetical protein